MPPCRRHAAVTTCRVQALLMLILDQHKVVVQDERDCRLKPVEAWSSTDTNIVTVQLRCHHLWTHCPSTSMAA